MKRISKNTLLALWFSTITPALWNASSDFSDLTAEDLPFADLEITDDEQKPEGHSALLLEIARVKEAVKNSTKSILEGKQTRVAAESTLYTSLLSLLQQANSYIQQHTTNASNRKYIEDRLRELEEATGKTLFTMAYARGCLFQLDDIFRSGPPLASVVLQLKEHVPTPSRDWRYSRHDLSTIDHDIYSSPTKTHAIACIKRVGGVFASLTQSNLMPRKTHLLDVYQKSLKKSLQDDEPPIYWAIWLACQVLEEILELENEVDAQLFELINQHRGNLLRPIAIRIRLDIALLQAVARLILKKIDTLFPSQDVSPVVLEQKTLTRFINRVISSQDALLVIRLLEKIKTNLDEYCQSNRINHDNPIATTRAIVELVIACLHSSTHIYEDFI